VSVVESTGSGHNRELTRERKLHPATVASMRLQNAIFGAQSAECNDHFCQQPKSLIESFRSIRLSAHGRKTAIPDITQFGSWGRVGHDLTGDH
jgi:hypothetical protein